MSLRSGNGGVPKQRRRSPREVTADVAMRRVAVSSENRSHVTANGEALGMGGAGSAPSSGSPEPDWGILCSRPCGGGRDGRGEGVDASHQLGRLGESFVRESLRASGYEVHDANLNNRGIDLLAVKRDPRGELVDVRPIEVKTRSQGVSFRLETTQDGPQLCQVDRQEARPTDAGALRSRPAPARVRGPVLEGRSSREGSGPSFTASRSATMCIRCFASNRSRGPSGAWRARERSTRFLKRIAEADVHPATRQAAIRHLQQFDQIRATVLSHEASSSAAVTRSANPADVASCQRPGATLKALPKAAEGLEAESSRVAKALPIAAKTLARVGLAMDGLVRGYQAYQVEQQYQRGEVCDRDRVLDHAKNGSGMACGWGGALALGSQGAAWGSALGPLGTAGGGLLGGVAGYLGGEKVAEVVVDHAADAIYAGTNATRDAAGWVGGQATQLWDLTKSHLVW